MRSFSLFYVFLKCFSMVTWPSKTPASPAWSARAEVRAAGVELDYDAQTAGGKTALDVAAETQQWAVFDALAAQGATAVGPGLPLLVLHRPELAAERVRAGARCEPFVLVQGAAAHSRARAPESSAKRGLCFRKVQKTCKSAKKRKKRTEGALR